MAASSVAERHPSISSNETKPYVVSSVGEQPLELGVLKNLIAYQLRRAQMAMFQSFNKQLEQVNITPGQIGLLLKIRHNSGISQTALARANGIERSTLGEIIDRFEKRQWVERRKHATDRRAYALFLSDQGDALLDRVLPQLMQLEADFTQDWDDDEKATLLKLLIKLADNNLKPA